MELSNEQKVRAAIKAALVERADLPDRVIGVLVSRAEPDLIAGWVADKLEALTRLLRPKPADAAQIAFPFHDISVHIPLRKGAAELRYATIGILRQSEKVLVKKQRTAKPRSNSMLGKIRAEIELMEPWAYVNRRVTVERVRELVASGAPIPDIPVRSPMADAMRRFWASKTPEERSAIWRARRQAKRKKAGK